MKELGYSTKDEDGIFEFADEIISYIQQLNVKSLELQRIM